VKELLFFGILLEAISIMFWLLITLGVVMTGFAIEALSLVIGMINLIKASESDLSTTF
jgi:hypothetical protein